MDGYSVVDVFCGVGTDLSEGIHRVADVREAAEDARTEARGDFDGAGEWTEVGAAKEGLGNGLLISRTRLWKLPGIFARRADKVHWRRKGLSPLTSAC